MDLIQSGRDSISQLERPQQVVTGARTCRTCGEVLVSPLYDAGGGGPYCATCCPVMVENLSADQVGLALFCTRRLGVEEFNRLVETNGPFPRRVWMHFHLYRARQDPPEDGATADFAAALEAVASDRDECPELQEARQLAALAVGFRTAIASADPSPENTSAAADSAALLASLQGSVGGQQPQ